MSLPESAVAVVERAHPLAPEWTTEPFEAAWAHEAIFFVRLPDNFDGVLVACVQISPNGLDWMDEGTAARSDSGVLIALRVTHFGGWLRLRGTVDGADEIPATVYLVLKE